VHVDRIHLVPGGVHWRALVNMAVNLVLAYRASVSFSICESYIMGQSTQK
jgi:hypothetical protein